MSGRLKKIAKYFLFACVAIALAAHLIFKYSGSGQWEPHSERKGVRIYSMKTPGSTLKKFKGVVRVRSTLTAAMALQQDPEVCQWVNCYESRMFEKVDERVQYYTFRWNYPFFFRPREFVIKQQFSRVPETNALLVDVIAAPDKLPPNDCCVRVETMHNTWKYTPLKNGDMELEYVINSDDGGFFPYFLANEGAPAFMRYMLPKMQTILDKQQQKFPNAKFELLGEK